MQYIPYIIAGLVILWAVFSLIRHFSRTKRGRGCHGCDGCCEACANHQNCDERKEDSGNISEK